MHELYAYAGMRINHTINYESKYEINYYKTGNYAISENMN